MAKSSRVIGSTSNILLLFIQDSSSATGAGKTGLVFNTAGLTAYYKRGTGTASVAITLATITTLGTWATGGFKEVDSANMAGVYEFHPPDAAFASGSKSVVFALKGAANMAQVNAEIELTGVDNQDAVAFGVSRIDAAISSRSTYAGGAVASVTAAVTVGTNSDKTGYALTAGEHTAVAADTQTGMTAQGYTAARAAFLDVLNGIVAAIWAAATRTLTALGVNVTVGGYAAGQDPATLVLDTAAAGHNTAATIGQKINASGGAADPLLNPVPAAYAAGTAGAALGNIPAIKAKTDLITTGTALSLVSAVVGGTITIRRGDTLSAALTGLASLTGWEKLWFTAKGDLNGADSTALIQIMLSAPGAGTDGLSVLNGAAAATPGQGSLSVISDTSITLAMDEAATAALALGSGRVYDVQMLRAGIVTTLIAGALAVTADVTRAIV